MDRVLVLPLTNPYSASTRLSSGVFPQFVLFVVLDSDDRVSIFGITKTKRTTGKVRRYRHVYSPHNQCTLKAVSRLIYRVC